MISATEEKNSEEVTTTDEKTPEDDESTNHSYYPFDNDMNLGILQVNLKTNAKS